MRLLFITLTSIFLLSQHAMAQGSERKQKPPLSSEEPVGLTPEIIFQIMRNIKIKFPSKAELAKMERLHKIMRKHGYSHANGRVCKGAPYIPRFRITGYLDCTSKLDKYGKRIFTVK